MFVVNVSLIILINKITAIRSNVGDLLGMKKAIHASLFHCASNGDHSHCPTGPSSWYGFQHDKSSYKHGPRLPLSVIAKVKPIYQRLSEDSLLEKCLHGKTQNQNEALNGMIWNRISKNVFVGRNLLEFGMFDAISHFNIGSKTIIQLFAQLNIPIGRYTEEGCRYMGIHHVYGAEYEGKNESEKRRKVLRTEKEKRQETAKRGGNLWCRRVLIDSLSHYNSI